MEENNAHKEDLIYQYACMLQLWVVAEWKMGKKKKKKAKGGSGTEIEMDSVGLCL